MSDLGTSQGARWPKLRTAFAKFDERRRERDGSRDSHTQRVHAPQESRLQRSASTAETARPDATPVSSRRFAGSGPGRAAAHVQRAIVQRSQRAVVQDLGILLHRCQSQGAQHRRPRRHHGPEHRRRQTKPEESAHSRMPAGDVEGAEHRSAAATAASSSRPASTARAHVSIARASSSKLVCALPKAIGASLARGQALFARPVASVGSSLYPLHAVPGARGDDLTS